MDDGDDELLAAVTRAFGPRSKAWGGAAVRASGARNGLAAGLEFELRRLPSLVGPPDRAAR